MLDRHIKAFGLPILVGYLLAIVAFIGLSFLIFYKTGYAVYLYIFIGLGSVARLSEIQRNDLLKSSFRKKEYKQIRILENALLAFPFVLILAIKLEFVAIFVLIISASLMALINYRTTFSKTILTPFGKYPFEFTVGFRKIFYLFGLAYFLVFMAVWVDNFNLGAFALMLVFVLIFSFYSVPEQSYFVWIYSKNTKQFLGHKIKILLRYTTWLALPVFIMMSIFFWDKFAVLVLLMLLGYVYVLGIVLAKYGSYPSQINIPDGFLIAMSFFFPPLLLALIPFFLRKSLRQLNLFLDDNN